MDLNGDGYIDILSGTYSRMEQDMAGTFQVLWGKEDGSFSAAETLNGTDGEPLLLPGSREENLTDRICTRPFAVDINGDGHLDIVTGNFTGTFYIFLGQGNGQFSPESSIIMAGDEPLAVPMHSDPFLVDWDGDGLLDIVSGSAQGGVFLSLNKGTKTEPSFSKPIELIPPVKQTYGTDRFGDEHITGPQSATRVWVDDINGNGKLDLLVGDSVRVMYLADGVDEDEARSRLAEWNTKQSELGKWWQEASRGIDHTALAELQLKKNDIVAKGGDVEEELSDDERATLESYDKLMQEYRERSTELQKSRNEIVRQQMTGFVWVYYQR